jgi:hypothetical protein
MRVLRIVAAAIALVGAPRPSHAQGPVPIAAPSPEAIRIGVVTLDPRFGISDAGIDTNVFATVEDPQRDVTATASTGGDLWLRTGRGLLLVQADTEYVYFDRFASERAFNTEARAAYEWRLNRLAPFVWGSTRDFKSRPNEEILARVRHYRSEYGGGSDIRLASRTSARAEWHRVRSNFDDSARFDDHELKTRLNQTRETVEVSVRQRLTALTSFMTRVSRDRNEFEHEPGRNSESLYVNAGFELGQFALIRGVVTLGYHDLRADDPAALPEFSGLTANVDVAYTAPSRTRLQAAVERELRQSYDPLTPHYTQLMWNAAVTQRIFGRWDVQVSGGRVLQDYLPTARASGRTDATERVGGGIGYSLTPHVRASFDITSVHRTSELQRRDYSGIVGGFSVGYGY